MDLKLAASTFCDTVYRMYPVTEAGQNFLGFSTEYVIVRKSDLGIAMGAAKAKGLTIGRD